MLVLDRSENRKGVVPAHYSLAGEPVRSDSTKVSYEPLALMLMALYHHARHCVRCTRLYLLAQAACRS